MSPHKVGIGWAGALLVIAPLGDLHEFAATSDTTNEIPGILYIYGDSSFRAIEHNARERVIRLCMEASGFEYEEHPQDVPNADPIAVLEATFGVHDAATAGQFGYVPPDAAAGDDEPLEQAVPDDNPAYVAALLGDRPTTSNDVLDPITGQVIGHLEVRSGCVGESDNALFVDPVTRTRYAALDYTLQGRALSAIQRAQSQQPVLDAIATWGECMWAAGYDYSHPWDVLEAGWPDPRPQPDEIRAALADVSCKDESSLVDVFVRAATISAEEAENEVPGLVEEWQTLNAAMLERAAELLAENS